MIYSMLFVLFNINILLKSYFRFFMADILGLLHSVGFYLRFPLTSGKFVRGILS